MWLPGCPDGNATVGAFRRWIVAHRASLRCVRRTALVHQPTLEGFAELVHRISGGGDDRVERRRIGERASRLAFGPT